MTNEILTFVLFGLMAVWNGYLLHQNHKLMNKLMSRNYSEYATAERFLKNEPEPETEEVEDPYDAQRAKDLNGIMGLG